MIKQKQHIAKLLVISLVISLGLVFAFPSDSYAATITVDDTATTDNTVDDNICTLSEAITHVNDPGNTTYDECTEAEGNDTILLPAIEIELTADLPTLDESFIIQGQGMGQTVINGNNGQFKVLQTQLGANFDVSGLTITAFEEVALGSNSEVASLSEIEIDGTNSQDTGSGYYAIGLAALSNTTYNFILNNIYVHDLEGATPFEMLAGVLVATGGDATVTASLDSITVRNISAPTHSAGGVVFLAGPLGGLTPSNVDASVTNATIDEISGAANATGIANTVLVNDGFSTASLDVTNSTIKSISGVSATSSIGGAAAAIQADAQSEMTVNSTNNILFESSDNCGAENINPLFPGSGTVIASLSSSGGNLSDDSTCEDYFTDPTDQNNVSGLAASLDPLTDNGGFVPTMALKANSPAIDSGVTVASLTTDARGALRPQGNAYDSGAYESPFTRQDEEENQNADEETLADTGDNEWLYALLGLGLITVTIPVIKLAGNN